MARYSFPKNRQRCSPTSSGMSRQRIINFSSYAKEKGLQLLPEDRKLIAFSTKQISDTTFGKIMRTYVQTWVDTMMAEECCYKKQNEGRKKANAYLHNALQL